MAKLFIATLIFLTAGCSTSTPNYDAKFGHALRDAKMKMTINPEAGTNPDTVAGMDGKSAREGIILYQNAAKAPPPAVNVINIGGAIGGR